MERSKNLSVSDNCTHHTSSFCGCSWPSAQADPRTGYLCGNDSRWIIRPLLVASQRWSTPSSSASLPPSSCLEYQVLFTLVVPLFFLSSCSDYRSTVSSSVLIPLLRHLSLNVHVCRCAPTVAYVKDRRST